MRAIEDHRVNGANEQLTVTATDAPGSGGANHRYEISGFTADNPSQERLGEATYAVMFQNGPIGEAGVNGITHEILLAIVADRLRSFQAGPFANRYNAAALEHAEQCLAALKARTEDRLAQGIEGTHVVGTESRPVDADWLGRAESLRGAEFIASHTMADVAESRPVDAAEAAAEADEQPSAGEATESRPVDAAEQALAVGALEAAEQSAATDVAESGPAIAAEADEQPRAGEATESRPVDAAEAAAEAGTESA